MYPAPSDDLQIFPSIVHVFGDSYVQLLALRLVQLLSAGSSSRTTSRVRAHRGLDRTRGVKSDFPVNAHSKHLRKHSRLIAHAR